MNEATDRIKKVIKAEGKELELLEAILSEARAIKSVIDELGDLLVEVRDK